MKDVESTAKIRIIFKIVTAIFGGFASSINFIRDD